LSSHRFASSTDGSLSPSFISTLFEDIMAAMWMQKNARWDGFPSSHLGQLKSLKRDTLETTFSFFKLPLKFFDQRRKSKSHVPGKNRRRTAARAPWADRPSSICGPVRSGFLCTPLISHFQPMRKRWPGKTLRETPENKGKTIYKMHTLFYVLG
jgi:hypothetical protein